MDNNELLLKVKRTNRKTGKYDDETLLELIEQVKTDIIGMGVKEEVANSPLSVGAIAQGVWEKDNLHQYTPDFEKQVIRLRKKKKV